MKAETTPSDRAYPNTASGGRGEMTLAMKAATVVTTASERGIERWPHARNHDSATVG